MTRDPHYYLQKADYFYKRALDHGYDMMLETVNNPTVKNEKLPVKEDNAKHNLFTGRYYNPITRHYYKNPDFNPMANDPSHNVIKKPGTNFYKIR
jgi:hypothetical protein